MAPLAPQLNTTGTAPPGDGIDRRLRQPRVSSLDALAGLEEVKDELRAQVGLWADPAQLAHLGGTPRAGLLFTGPTGTGKTAAAHALAAESGRALNAFAGPDFHDEAGKDLLATVLWATTRQPSVVFIDEADDLVHVRDFRANEIANRAARDWGFSRHGARTAPAYPEAVVEARLDSAAAELIAEAEARAVAVLTANRPALVVLAERLAVHRRAGARELRAWLGDQLRLTSPGERQ